MRGMRSFILTWAAVLAMLFAPSRELRTNAWEAHAADGVSWSVQTSGMDTNLRGISAADNPDSTGQHVVVWACGSNGVILFSSDLGKTWKRLHVAGGDALDFRSIVAFDAKAALVMSSGEGDKSRIYKTTDGGENWKLEFSDKRPSFFLDALVCDGDCYALSDPVDGKFVLVAAHNGEDWKELPRDAMPAALAGEGAFAASGTALAMDNDGDLFFGTGGGKAARVFHSSDFGKTWTVFETPIASGNASSGIFSIVATPWAVIAVGGDYKDPSRPYRVAAYSTDRGKTWSLATQQPGGYRSAVVALYGAMLAVGPTGEDISDDFGAHWKHTDSLDLNAAFVLDIDNGWAVGAKGTIARLVNHIQYQIRNDSPRNGAASASASLSR
jgi:photosystem II stability/assembly factor-like uncharacterized protein